MLVLIWFIFILSAIAIVALTVVILNNEDKKIKGCGKKKEDEWYQFSDIKDYEEYMKNMKYKE